MWQKTDQRLDDLVFPVKIEAQALLSPGDIVFHKSLTLRLSSRLPGTVRYRLEPLDYFNPPALPDAASPVYNGPIEITTPTVIYAAVFDAEVIGSASAPSGASGRSAEATCRVYDGSDVDEAVRKHRAAGDGAERPYPDFAAQGLKPVLTFPLGRLTFKPSHEGVYFTSSYLVMEGRIKVPADGDYQFFADGGAEVLVNGQWQPLEQSPEPGRKPPGRPLPKAASCI